MMRQMSRCVAGNFSEYIMMPLPSTRLAVSANQLKTALVDLPNAIS